MNSRYSFPKTLKSLVIGATIALVAGCSSNSYEVTQYRLPHLNQSAEALCQANKRPVFVGDSAAKPGLQLQQDDCLLYTSPSPRD